MTLAQHAAIIQSHLRRRPARRDPVAQRAFHSKLPRLALSWGVGCPVHIHAATFHAMQSVRSAYCGTFLYACDGVSALHTSMLTQGQAERVIQRRDKEVVPKV